LVVVGCILAAVVLALAVVAFWMEKKTGIFAGRAACRRTRKRSGAKGDQRCGRRPPSRPSTRKFLSLRKVLRKKKGRGMSNMTGLSVVL